jgi:hypothetical protein
VFCLLSILWPTDGPHWDQEDFYLEGNKVHTAAEGVRNIAKRCVAINSGGHIAERLTEKLQHIEEADTVHAKLTMALT